MSSISASVSSPNATNPPSLDPTTNPLLPTLTTYTDRLGSNDSLAVTSNFPLTPPNPLVNLPTHTNIPSAITNNTPTPTQPPPPQTSPPLTPTPTTERGYA